MATTIGALRVELSANIAKFEAAMGKAAKHMARTQRSFAKFGSQATAAGRSLSVGLTAPLVAVGALSAKSFLSFEQGMNKVAAVSGATEAEMAELTAIAKDLGATTSFSAAQAAEGLGFLAQAGFDATEAGRALPGVLQLAAAGGIQLAEAADIATNVLAGYGLEIDQLARVNDVLAKASSSANTDVLQLGQAFKFAGPVASSAGVSFETSGAAMALMGNAGIQAEMAGTALRGAIAKLVNPSQEASKTLAALGISATDSTGRLRPLDQVIEQLAPHADNTGAIMKIFGQRAGPAMSALISQGADALREMTTALEQSGGTAQEIADKKLAGLTGAWTRLQSATEGVFIEIGTRLSPVLERLAAVITDRVLPAVRGALEAFDRLSPGIKTAAVVGAGLAAALGPVLIATGGLVSVFTPVLPLIAKFGLLTKLGAVAAGVLKTAFAVLTGPIGLTAAAVIAFLASTQEGRAVLSATGTLIKEVVVFAFNQLRDVLVWAGEQLVEFGKWLSDLIMKIPGLARLINWLTKKAGAAGDAMSRMNDQADTRRLREEAQAAADRFTEIEKEAKAAEDRLRGFGKRIKLNPAAFREMSARAAEMRAEVDRLGTGGPASLKRLEAALDTARKEMGLTAQSTNDAGAAIDELGESATGAGQPADDLASGVGGLSDEVQTLVDRLRGTGAIQAAHNWADAVEAAGGMTTLTRDETTQLVTTLDTAITKWKALGEAVPVDVFERFMEASDRVRLNPPEQLFTQVGFEIADLHPTAIRAAHQQRMQAFRDMLDDARLTVGNLPPIGISLEPEITPRFRTTIERAFTGFGAEIGPTFARALEGGGNFLGAAQSLGVQGGNRLGEALSGGLAKKMTATTGVFSKGIGKFFGGAMGQAIPFLGPLIGMGIGKIFGLFKKPSEAELAARKHAKDYEDTIIKSLNASQLDEAAEAARGHWAGNERGAQFLIGVRDAYVAAGRSAAEGEQAVGRYWKAVRDGSPEAVGAITAQIDAVVAVGREQQQRVAELEQMREAGQAAFNPALIEPYLEKLLETGTITQQQAAELRALADEAHVDHEAMAAAAEKYGVKLSALGPAFDQARISDAASVIVTDFELLTQEGANVNGVLRGMQDEVQDLVSDALTAGVAIPEGMRPIIESLIEQGRLTDENGEKLTDVSQLTFAEPLAEKFDTLIEKLTALIEKITGRGGITEAIAGIPRDVEVGVDLRYREHDRPEGLGGGAFEFARHGTPFRHFGRGTPAMLHGLERVMTAREGRGIAGVLAHIQHGLGAIADLSGVRALAEGGLVTRPTLATFAEHGPEVAIPLERLEAFGGGRRVEAKLDQLHQDFALLIDEFRHGLDPRRRERAVVAAAALSTT